MYMYVCKVNHFTSFIVPTYFTILKPFSSVTTCFCCCCFWWCFPEGETAKTKKEHSLLKGKIIWKNFPKTVEIHTPPLFGYE